MVDVEMEYYFVLAKVKWTLLPQLRMIHSLFASLLMVAVFLHKKKGKKGEGGETGTQYICAVWQRNVVT